MITDNLPKTTKAIHQLKQLLQQLTLLRQQAQEIKNITHKFTFKHLLTNKPSQPNSNRQLDKENININVQKPSPKLLKPATTEKKSLPKRKQHSLKENIIKELNELKILEKREESIRRTNEKLKHYYGERKKEYQSRSKDKKQKIDGITLCQSIGKSSTNDSKISMSISFEPKVLYCSRGHEYYEGLLNHKAQPHGNGRFFNCCGDCPNAMNYYKFEDIDFYQGEFYEGKFNGFGTLKYKGGIKYVGEFKKGMRSGRGSLYFKGKAETAKWENDKFIAIL